MWVDRYGICLSYKIKRQLDDLHVLFIQFDLVLSRCPTEAEGGRGHFLFDPLSVEPDLCEVAPNARPA